MIKVKVNELLNGLKNVKPALNKKGALVLATQDVRLMLQANDGSCAASSVVSLEEDTVSNEFFVNYNAFVNALSAVKRIVGDEAVAILEVENCLKITCNATSINVPLLSEEDCSVLGEVGTSTGQVTVNGHLLKKALNSAISRGGKRIYLFFRKECFGSAGTDAAVSSMLNNCAYVKSNTNNVPIPDGETQLVVTLSAVRAKGIASVIDEDSDVTLFFYEHNFACVHGSGNNLISVPVMTGTDARVSWLTSIVQIIGEASEGSTYEVNRKEFLNSLELLLCNQDTNNGVVFSFEYTDGALILRNREESAQTQISFTSSDGTFEGKYSFNTVRMKEIAGALEGEDLLMTLSVKRSTDGTQVLAPLIHFEEGTEQIVFFGLSQKKLDASEENTKEADKTEAANDVEEV